MARWWGALKAGLAVHTHTGETTPSVEPMAPQLLPLLSRVGLIAYWRES
jgi:hypothetical protein